MPLSEQERARIEEEERYRAEVRQRIRQEQYEVLRRERLERRVSDRVRARDVQGKHGRRLLIWVLAAAGAGFLGAAVAVGSGFFLARDAEQGAGRGSGSTTSPPSPERSAQPTDRPADSPATSPRSTAPREPATRPLPPTKAPTPQSSPTELPRAPARKPEPPPSLPPRSAVPPGDRVELMASRLVETLGPERAEEAANANAAMYERGDLNFVYWRSVAAAIRSGKAQETSRRLGS